MLEFESKNKYIKIIFKYYLLFINKIFIINIKNP